MLCRIFWISSHHIYIYTQQADTSSAALKQSPAVFQSSICSYLSAFCPFIFSLNELPFLFSNIILFSTCVVLLICFRCPPRPLSALFLTLSTAVTPFTSCPTSTSCLPFSFPVAPLSVQCQQRGYPPRKHEADQRADEYHHLVKHGRVGPLDRPVEIILQRDAHRCEATYGNHSSPNAALLKCKMRIKHSRCIVKYGVLEYIEQRRRQLIKKCEASLDVIAQMEAGYVKNVNTKPKVQL